MIGTQQAKLTADDPGTNMKLGTAVAISGNTAVVGAPANAAAYVFERSGDVWQQQQKLKHPRNSGGNFGGSVAVSGNTVMVGSNNETTYLFDEGVVHVFERSGAQWSHKQELQPSLNQERQGDQFGFSVAMEDDTAIIGAIRGGLPADGAAYVFQRGADGNWVEQQELVEVNAEDQNYYGYSVAVSGDTAIVGAVFYRSVTGAQGAVYVFIRQGAAWVQQAVFTGPVSPYLSYYGASVAVSGDTFVVGSAYEDLEDPNADAGAVHVYTRSVGTWSEQQRLVAADPAADLHFGTAVGISGDVVVAGADGYDDPAGANSGAAYVFTRSDSVWTQQRKYIAPDAAEGDVLGSSIAISADTAVVGAPQDDLGKLTDAGSAHVLVPGEPPSETPEFSVGLEPGRSSGPAGTSFTLSATVKNRKSAPAADREVRFSVIGDNTASGGGKTNQAGVASFTYQGEVAGEDTVTAFVDANSDGLRQALEPEAMAIREWTPTVTDPPVPSVNPGKVRFWGECFSQACPNKPITPEGLTSMVGVSAGSDHWLALDKDGGVWAWGSNDAGQLGDGTVSQGHRQEPVQVKDGQGQIFRALSISAGGGFSLALGRDGALWGWGRNGSGQLGNGTMSDSPVPVRVLNPESPASPFTNIKAYAAGNGHSLAVSQDGTVWSWGCNSEGELGRGSPRNVSAPFGFGVQCLGEPSPGKVLQEDGEPLRNVASVAVGAAFSLALRSDGTLRAWGYNGYGQLGDGTRTNRLRPIPVLDPRPGDSGRLLASVKSLSAGQNLGMVVKNNGTIWGWGENSAAQLARDPAGGFSIPTPSRILGLPKMADVAAGYLHVIASDAQGALWAWGETEDGNGSYSEQHIDPFKVQNIGGPAAALSAKTFTSLVLARPPTGPPAIRLRPDALAFAEQDRGSESGAKTLGITNVGIDPLTVSSIEKQGDNPADFEVKSDGCTAKSLAANRSCSVGVTFSPGAIGSRRATLRINHNAEGSPHLVNLTGTGIEDIEGPTTPAEPRAGDWWGDLDTTFNPCKNSSFNDCNGRALSNPGDAKEREHWGSLNDTALQPDGKIVAGGSGAGVGMVLRFNPDGSMDQSFAEKGVARIRETYTITAIALQNDGKIAALAGNYLIRLLPNGAPDLSFGEGGIVRDPLGGTDLVVQPDGKIVVSGSIKGPPRPRAAWACPGEDPVHCRQDPMYLRATRFNTDGQRDKTFGTNGVAVAPVGNGEYALGWTLALQPDGKVVVAGGATRVGDVNSTKCLNSVFFTVYYSTFFIPLYCRDVKFDFAAARFNTDGAADNTFGDKGAVTTAFDDNSAVFGLTVQPDGKIVAVGCVKGAYCNWGSSQGGFGIVRYKPDGTLDENEFGVKGKVVTDFREGAAFPTDVVVASDGDIVAAGAAGPNLAVARYSSQGILEENFDDDGKAVTPPPCGMNPRHKACFITSEDIHDAGVINAIAIQPGDGKVVGAGVLSDGAWPSFSGQGDSNLMLIRYTSQGSVDPGFGDDGLVLKKFDQFDDSMPEAVAVQPDGKIVVAGRANDRNDYYDSEPALVRYDANGALDKGFGDGGRVVTPESRFIPGFREGAGYDDMVVQPDGKILAVGHTDLTWDPDRVILARYNPDGSLDAGFNPCEPGETACEGVIAFVGGKMNSVNGFATVDLQPQSDGQLKIIVGAKALKSVGRLPFFVSDTTTSGLALIRLNADGTLDESFGNGGISTNSAGTEMAGEVYDLAMQSDRKIVALSTGSVARFEPNGAPDSSFNGSGVAPIEAFGYGLATQKIQQGDKQVENIVVAGRITYPTGGQLQSAFTVLRLKPNGTPDHEFGGACEPPNQSCGGGRVLTRIRGDDRANDLVVQPDGKIVAVGSSYLETKPASNSGWAEGRTDLALVRYRPNGELDNCFKPASVVTPVGSGSNAFGRDVALQPDGKIVASASAWDKNSKFGVARYRGGNSDPGREISISPTATVAEPDSGKVPAAFTVSLTAPACENVEVDYATSNGSAEAGKDYEQTSGRLTIPKGKRDAVLTVPVLADNTPEDNEDFVVTISSPGASVIQPKGRATILDSRPGLRTGDASVVEGNAGKVRAVFDVTLNGGGHKTVKVDYSTADGTAKAGSDYDSASGTLTFAPGEIHKTVTVQVIGDTIDEEQESFLVNLTNPANTTLARSKGTGTIVDDDGPPPSPEDGRRGEAGIPPFIPGPLRGGDVVSGGVPPESLPPPSTVSTGQVQAQAQGQAQLQSQAQAQSNFQANSQTSGQTAGQLQAQPGRAPDLQAQMGAIGEREREREFNVEVEGAGDHTTSHASRYLATARTSTVPGAATAVAWAGSIFALAAGLFYRNRAEGKDKRKQLAYNEQRLGEPGPSDAEGVIRPRRK
ncbi:MAG: Calx-beta domain-containing protein [Actinomycetota bacterium]